MKMFFYGLLTLLACLSLEVNAQFKSSEQQYLSEENLAINGGFEQGKKNWTNANGTFSIDSSFKVLGNSSGKVQLTAQTLDFSQQLTTGYNASLSGLQGQVSAYVKSNFPFEICALIDGNETSCLQGKSDNSFDFYQIPIVLGGTSLGIKFKSVSSTGIIYVDGVSYGHKQFVQDIAQAQIAGEAYFTGTSGCIWARTSTAIGGFSPVAACPAPTITFSELGEWQSVDTNLPQVTVNNLPAGIYKARFIAAGYMNNPAGHTIAINDGTTTCSPVRGEDSNSAQSGFVVECIFKYNTAGNRVFTLWGGSAANTINITNNQTSPNLGTKFILEYYPPKSKIVTQLQEETVETANEFSARIAPSTGIVSKENLDWINGNCSIVSSSWHCPVVGFTEIPNCQVTTEASNNYVGAFLPAASSITNLVFRIVDAGNGPPNTGVGFNVICQKQGADYNKSRMIVGQFEQIKTTELCEVEAYGNSGETISGSAIEDIPWETVTRENCLGSWNNNGNTGNNTKDTFTPVRDGVHIVSFSFRLTSSNNLEVWVYKDNVFLESMGSLANNAISSVHAFSKSFYMEAGSNYSFRIATAINLVLNQADEDKLHKISIKEIGDIAGIVKNLNDNRNVKCQTKFLNSNYTAGNTDNLTDLLFSNLTIGKKYRYTLNVSAVGSLGYAKHNGINTIQVAVNTSPLASVSQSSYEFIATNTSIQTGVSNNSGGTPLFGSGDLQQTFVRLCELPDNYIETTEW